MKKLAIILSFVLTVLFISCKDSTAQQSTLLEPQELIDVLASQDVYFVDVRTSKEFSQGHIANAINIDFKSSSFEEEIKKLDTLKPIVIYCRSGRRSAMSTKILDKVGFDEIYDLKGGVLNWTKQGKALEKE